MKPPSARSPRLIVAERNLAALPPDAPARPAALIAVAREVLHRAPLRAIEVATEAAALALDGGDLALRFEALCVVASGCLSLSDFVAAESTISTLGALVDSEARSARHLSLRAMRAQRGGDLQGALALTFEALRLWERSGEATSRRAASTHNLAGNLLAQFADFAGAIEHFHRALSLYAEDPDDDVTAVIANNLGRAYRELGHHSAAEEVFLTTLSRFPADDDSFVRTILTLNLGQLLVDAGRSAEAVGILTDALVISQARGYARATGGLLHSLGLAHQAAGDLAEAGRRFEAAHEVRAALGEQADLTDTQVRYAALLVEMGRADEAVAMLGPLLDGPTAHAWLRIRADALLLLHHIARARGELERALDLHVAYHDQCKVFLDDRATLRCQALHVRHQVQQLARERETEHALRLATEVLAQTDPLTGLPNRRHVDGHIDAAVATHQPFALVFADIDHFKQVNDRFSHAVGDAVLRSVARVLQSTLRSGDVVGRYGGEEFVLVFPGCGLEAARQACERLRAAIRAHDWAQLHPELTLTISFGVAATKGDRDRAEMLAAADGALYRAKANGRDRVERAQGETLKSP